MLRRGNTTGTTGCLPWRGSTALEPEDAHVVWLAWGTVVAQLLFIGGWLVLGALEGRGYSAARHDISDLSALTAKHPWVDLATEGIAGLVTIAFAIWSLRPTLTGPARGGAVGAWLVALSLPALDGVGDVFFRLDCRAADAGCTAAAATTSWHGKLHTVVFVVAVLATLAAPFVLARCMRLVDGWRDLARPARAFGWVTIAGAVAAAAAQGSAVQGYAQRVLAAIVPLGVVVLALRVRRLARQGSTTTSSPGLTVPPSSTHA